MNILSYVRISCQLNIFVRDHSVINDLTQMKERPTRSFSSLPMGLDQFVVATVYNIGALIEKADVR